jgi:uncharacterized membrane protein YfcA
LVLFFKKEHPFLELFLLALGAAAAGFVQGLTGFAFALVSMAFWAWVLPPGIAAPLVVACSLLGQLVAGRRTWAGFRSPAVWPFLAGGLVGVPLGTWVILPRIDPAQFRLALGLFLVLWCPAMLFAARLPPLRWGGRGADALAGWVGGLLGGIGGLSGPVPSLWVNLRHWNKDAQRALFQAFNTTMHTLSLAAMAAGGLVTTRAAMLFLLAAPCMVLPALAGARLYARISEVAFRRVVLALLWAAGSILVFNGFSKPG